jgi:exosortase/archaeosortase family protein
VTFSPVAFRTLLAVVWFAGWLPFWHSRRSGADAVAALAAGFLLVVALRRPGARDLVQVPTGMLATVGVLVLMGIGAGLTLPVALGLLVLAGFAGGIDSRHRDELRVLAVLALPWLATDGAQLALAFRHSAAWATETVYQVLGFAAVRDGTTITIEGQPLGVVAACAGLDTLHATLVSGAWLAGVLRGRRRFWLAVGLLPALAWLANTTRVITLGGVALLWGPDVASGWLHDWGGLAVILLMFALAGALVGALRRGDHPA